MDITAYIRELLFGHDCVIVPGFGGFIGNYTPAVIDKATSTFHPPVKQISFNRNLNHNDGLLIGRISESAGINYGDARNLVEQFVENTRRKLSKGEKVVFDKIGSFHNNHEGNVQFEPDREVNYYLNSYGLTSFQVSPLEGYDVRKRVLPYGSDPGRKVALRKILWRAAVIIPLLGILVTVPLTTDIFRSKIQKTSMNPLAVIEVEANNAGEIQAADIQSDIEKEPVSQPPEVYTEVYGLITGSFRSEANAESLQSQLAREGYQAELLDGPNGFYRVSALRCHSIDEATEQKNKLAHKYPGIWITRIR